MSAHRLSDFTVSLGEGTPKQGERNAVSPIFRSTAATHDWPKIPGVETLYDMFEKSVRQYADCKCLGWRPMVDGQPGPYQWMTYREAQEKAIALASAIAAVGVKAHGKVGIYSPNVPEWMLTIQACNRSTCYVVPLYDSLGESAVEYTVNHSATALIFAQGAKLPLLLKAVPATKKHLKTVVFWGAGAAKDVEAIEKEGVKVYTFDDFMALGEGRPAAPRAPQASDPATIMYTSGTTGNPKGVVLTHANVVTCVAGLQAYLKIAKISVNDTDSTLSYLTLAHIFGRALEEFVLSLGGSIGYWQGDVRKLTDDVTALRPTLFVAVPRVLERIQSGIEAKIKKLPWLLQALIGLAHRHKLAALRRGVPLEQATPWLDALLFRTFRKGFGGRVRFVFSGGAPLATHVEEYLAVTLCAPVFQGYGLTETCAASFLALPLQSNSGTVGPPTAGVELRFEGSEELGYDPLGTPPKGEICLRGPMVFAGYYEDDKKTKEAFDAEGWFHTGDVGELNAAGCLKVVDRIKNMFKLAQGEYVAAEHLENTYSAADPVEMIWVYGNSYESFLVAIVVPDRRKLLAWAAEHSVNGSYEDVCKNPKAAAFLVEALGKTGKAAKLKGFERISAVHLTPEPFSVDNDLMTPSFKLKRPQLQKRFQVAIDDMYAKTKADLKAKGKG